MATALLTTNPRQTPLYRRPAVSVRPKMDAWTKLAFVLLIGYSSLGRAFAYLGIPPAKIFIGDVALLCFIVFQQKAFWNRWFGGIIRAGIFCPLSWTLLISLMYGVVEVVYGILAGNEPLTALQILVFNLYPFYIFLGIWAGIQRPDLLRKFVRFCAWFTTIYGPISMVFLQNVTIMIPGTDVPILSPPGSGSGAILGLLCLEANPARFWFPITICAFMTLAMQIRADWVGFSVGLLLWGVLSKKLQQLFVVSGLLIALLVIGFVADIKFYNPGRESEVSTREILGRAISSVDPELAQDYSKNSAVYAGTVTWRQNWWKAIREEVAKHKTTLLFGLGYGYPIKDLVPYLKGMDIRTPHSVLYFALGYSGLVGLAIFLTLQICLLRLFWLVYKTTGQVYGIANWVAVLLGACFGNVFETPVGAIPLYIVAGLCLAPLVQARVSLQPQQIRQPVLVRRPQTPLPVGAAPR